MEKQQIVLSGTQSTGKSTILQDLKPYSQFEGYTFITEVFRDLKKEYNINLNEKSDVISQTLGFDKYIELFMRNKDKGFISDRSLIDVLAYTKYLYENKSISWEFYVAQLMIFEEFHKVYFNKFTYYYFPIEFPVVGDDVRSIDENYRKAIDNNILQLFEIFKINLIVVKGSIGERLKIFLK